MRMPPLLADFIYNRVCELKCEKFLTRPMCCPISNQYPDKIADKIINIKTAANDRLDDFDNNWDNDCSQP